MVQLTIYLTVLLVFIDAALLVASQDSSSGVLVKKIKKKKKEDRSTSSSSGVERSGESTEGETLSSSGSAAKSTSSEKNKKYWPKSSEERHGWRKWHRKCKKCPEDARKKWKDPTVKWICGAYQRARRSFKSKCMMEYRNCQDGTMFVKVYDHRCRNDSTKDDYPHGDHFFYEYRVKLSDESDDTSQSSESTDEETDGSSSY